MENRWSYDTKRNYGSQVRSMTIRFDFKLAVQFVQALAHSGPVPTPASGASFTKASQSVHRNAASAIWYFKHLRLLVNKKVRFLLCAPPRSEQTGFLRC